MPTSGTQMASCPFAEVGPSWVRPAQRRLSEGPPEASTVARALALRCADALFSMGLRSSSSANRQKSFAKVGRGRASGVPNRAHRVAAMLTVSVA